MQKHEHRVSGTTERTMADRYKSELLGGERPKSCALSFRERHTIAIDAFEESIIGGGKYTDRIGELLTQEERHDSAIDAYKKTRKAHDYDTARRALEIAWENQGESFELSRKVEKTRHHGIFTALKVAATTAVIATSIAISSPRNAAAQTTTYPDTSRTWGGYVIESADSGVSAIKSSWVVEKARAAADSGVGYTDLTQWIGIGGSNPHGSLVFDTTRSKGGALNLKAKPGMKVDTTLIQIGTESENVFGKAKYSAWIETLPDIYHKLGPNKLVVNAGDTMNASISLVEGTRDVYEVRFENLTTGQSYSERIRYSSSRRSAEFITEIPLGMLTVSTKPKGTFKVGFGRKYTGGQENVVVVDSVEEQIGKFRCRPVVLQMLQLHGRYPTFSPGRLEGDGSFEMTYEAEPK